MSNNSSTKTKRKMVVKKAWEGIIDSIKSLNQHNKEFLKRFSELDTRAILIDPLINALGWDPIDEVKRNNTIKTDKMFNIKNSKAKVPNFIDYVLKTKDEAKIGLIEAKKYSEKQLDQIAFIQVKYYAENEDHKDVRWYLLTDGCQFKFCNKAKKLIVNVNINRNDNEFDILFDNFLWFMCKEASDNNDSIRQENKDKISSLMCSEWEKCDLENFINGLDSKGKGKTKHYLVLLAKNADDEGNLNVNYFEANYQNICHEVLTHGRRSAYKAIIKGKLNQPDFINKENLFVEEKDDLTINVKYLKMIKDMTL